MSSTCLSPLCNRAPYPCWVLFMSVSLILSTVPCIQQLLISVCSKWKLEFISSTRPSMVPGWHRCTNCFIIWTNATNLFFFLHRCFRWLNGKEAACQWSRCRFEADAGSIPGLGNPLQKEMATHFSILAWEIPWTEEPGGLQSMGSQRVRHNLVTKQPNNKLFKP